MLLRHVKNECAGCIRGTSGAPDVPSCETLNTVNSAGSAEATLWATKKQSTVLIFPARYYSLSELKMPPDIFRALLLLFLNLVLTSPMLLSASLRLT